MPRLRLSKAQYTDGILSGNRVVLSQAITLIESTLPADKLLAQAVLENILPQTGKAIRLGITGVPGVGKSTFIETFGKYITQTVGEKLAVLAIDPTSQLSKGSILGDKTRMETLAREPLAYIRPSPTSGSLGGVAHRTRETILLCEAAGFEVIIVETVGVGQSETLVRGMVDFFLLLMLAGAGDELQGIKRGIMEMADGLAITKSDGDNIVHAQQAKTAYQNALHLYPPHPSGWQPPVLTCSALTGAGVGEMWAMVENYITLTKKNSYFTQNRQIQNLNWMHEFIRQALEEKFYQNPDIQEILPSIEQQVVAEQTLPMRAAMQLLRIFGG